MSDITLNLKRNTITVLKGLVSFALVWSHKTRKHSQLFTSTEELQVAETGHLLPC